MRPEVVEREPEAIFAGAASRSDLERRYRRRPLIAAALLIATIIAAAGAVLLLVGDDEKEQDTARGEGNVVLRASEGSRLASMPDAEAARLSEGKGQLPVPETREVSDGSATVTYRVDERELRSRLADAPATLTVPEIPIASRIRTPVIQQQFSNNCETAALAMLLASQGVEQDQTSLQEAVAHDGPLDPETGPDGGMVWGDPERGFVGRVDGGGTAGGFGVYEQPILDLANRYVDAVDLTGKGPDAVYQQLLRGRPVFTWIGLQDGPYETWQSPRGEEVTVNYGEHTVLLIGIEGDRLLVNDPLDGQRKWWSKAEFEVMFDRLDQRAISAA